MRDDSIVEEKLSDKREYVESKKETNEIENIKSDFAKGKFLTLKEFLLKN